VFRQSWILRNPVSENLSLSLFVSRLFLGPAPSRKSSMNTTPEVDSGHSPRIPTSMPVPAVPRRTGPPRKKSSKPTAPPEPPKEEAKADPDADLVDSTSVPLPGDPESTGPATKGASITQVKVGDLELEDSPALHEELEKPEIAKSSNSLLPLSDTHSPVLQQTDLPPIHVLETPGAIGAVDEVALQHSSSLSAIPQAQPAIVEAAEDASAVEHEDDVAHEDLNAESLASQAGLSPTLHSETSKSVREDFLHGN